jgi:Mg-chelatase subunit ChlD
MSEFSQQELSIPNSLSIRQLINENINNNPVNIKFGENGRAGYKTTGNSCLDMFSTLSRGSTKEKIIEMFIEAYTENQETALKIMMNYRDRNGKQEKDIPREMMKFLKKNCPSTYIANLLLYIENGYLKDLCVLALETKHINNISSGIEAKMFVALLIADKEALIEDKMISLAGKWAPRQKSKYSFLANKIAVQLPEMNGKNIKIALKNYRTCYCTPLNKKLNTFEMNMTAKNYDNIKIEQIPATALKKTKKALLKNMPEKYAEYLSRCRTGEVKMKTTGVQAHELISDIMRGDETAEIALNEIIRKLGESKLFENTLPLCDVSGSMSGVPMEVSITLGYIVSQLQNEEFKNKVMTFETNPQLVNIIGETTKEKLKSLRNIPWGGSTNIIKAFEVLLKMTKDNKINKEKMIKKIIIFTDMQFNMATKENEYMSAYQEIKNMYNKEKLKLPEIVFWNLRDSIVSIPVNNKTPGVALMNGFSSNMLKVFMEEDEMTPNNVMIKAIEKYEVNVLGERINI